MSLKPAIIVSLACVGLVGVSSQGQKPAAPSKPKLAVSIKPSDLANALRAVILSDREVYARVFGEQQRDSAPESPGSKRMPNPCEMLRAGSQSVASKGVEYSYVLRSLQPVNPRNAPETEVETKGLQFLATRPDLSYASDELLGGRWYYTAVYADVAFEQSCVTCHNARKGVAAKEYKRGDVLGGLVVRIALEL